MNALSDAIMLAVAPPVGAFFSTLKPVVFLMLLVPWWVLSTWIDKDSRRVHSTPLMWDGLILAAGTLGVLLWLLLPWYAAGLSVYLLLTGSVLGAYVSHRNKRVVPEARVLTGEHLRSMFAKTHHQRVQVVQHLKLYGADGKIRPPPPEDAPARRQAYNLMQELLRDAVRCRAARQSWRRPARAPPCDSSSTAYITNARRWNSPRPRRSSTTSNASAGSTSPKNAGPKPARSAPTWGPSGRT